MVWFAISAANSSSIRYSEVNGSSRTPARRRRAGHRAVAREVSSPSTRAPSLLIQAEQVTELPTQRPQRPRRAGQGLRGIGRGEPFDEDRELVGSPPGRRQRPDVLEPKVGDDLVDPPRTRGVRAVWESRLSFMRVHCLECRATSSLLNKLSYIRACMYRYQNERCKSDELRERADTVSARAPDPG